MKIAIVGTSNSIMVEGYFSIYRAIEYPHQVDNFSLGGSYNQYGLLANELYKIADDYDVVIFDFGINDGGRVSLFSEELVYTDLFCLISLLKQKCKLINLIFCTNNGEYNKSCIQHHNRLLCEELNIPYIDVWSCLESIPNKKEPVFKDGGHISSFYSKLLAILLKQKRIEITSCNYKIKNGIKDYLIKRKLPKYNFFIKSAEEIKEENPNIPLKIYGSSLVAYKVVELSENNNIRLSINNAWVIGMLGYIDNQSGWLSINNYNKLFTRADSRNGNFYFKTIKEPIYIKDNLEISSRKKIQNINCLADPCEIDFGNKNHKNKIAFLLFSKQKIEKLKLKEYDLKFILNKKYLSLYLTVNNILKTKNYKNINSANILYLTSFIENDNILREKIIMQAIKLKNNPYFYIALADILLSSKKIEESLKYYLEAFKKLKNEKELIIKIFQCYFSLKNYVEAEILLKQAIDENPFYPHLYRLYALLLLDKNEIEKAKENIKKFYSFAPYSLYSAYTCIDFYKKINDKITIIELLKSIYGKQTTLNDYIKFIKKCHEFQQYELGFRAYKEALKEIGQSNELENAYSTK